MTLGQKAQSKAELLLKMLAEFEANCQDICTRRICRGQDASQQANGSDPNCRQIATIACELSKLLDDEILIFEDEEEGGYDYCTGHSYHNGWSQALLEEQVIYSTHKGWY